MHDVIDSLTGKREQERKGDRKKERERKINKERQKIKKE
jgi:hypothetical protein